MGAATAWRPTALSRRRNTPGRAFAPGGLPDLPGRGNLWPNPLARARRRTAAWTLHPGPLRNRNACGFRLGKVRLADCTFDA